MMEGSMIDQYEDDDPGEGSSISPKKRMEDLMNGGKEDYTAGYFESAAMKFAEALMLSKKGYGELAAECFEPSFFYAKTMLDWARCMSNTSRETELAQVLLEEFHERLMEAGTRFQTEEKSREVHDDTSKTHGESDETMKSSDVDLKPMEKMTNGNSKTSAKEENEQAKVEEKGELSGGRAEGASKLASKTLDEKNIEMRKKLPDPHRGEENLNEDDNKFVKVDDGGGEKSGGRVAAKNEEDEFENVSKVLSGLDYNVKTVAGLKKRAPAPNDFSGCAEHARTDGSMNYMKETNEIGDARENKKMEIEGNLKKAEIERDEGVETEQESVGVLDEDDADYEERGAQDEDSDVTSTEDDQSDRMVSAWDALQDALLVCENHLEEEGWKEKKADALFTLAEWYMADTNYKEAINVINLSIDLFTDQYDRRIAAAYYELARAYQSDGQSSKAVEAQKKMTEVLSGRLALLEKESAEAAGDKKCALLSEIDDLKEIIHDIDTDYDDPFSTAGNPLQADEVNVGKANEQNEASKRSADDEGDGESGQKRAKLVERRTMEPE
ncbi:unnamed protein product [Toxocara canis]|uniref:TPR_REGION domain-containing protein n=1 Tax=Toxocara canis TaxID=6265 RepID=A0A183UK16_TOXCA|nr:unnamed protein product [Toxocara canis]